MLLSSSARVYFGRCSNAPRALFVYWRDRHAARAEFFYELHAAAGRHNDKGPVRCKGVAGALSTPLRLQPRPPYSR